MGTSNSFHQKKIQQLFFIFTSCIFFALAACGGLLPGGGGGTGTGAVGQPGPGNAASGEQANSDGDTDTEGAGSSGDNSLNSNGIIVSYSPGLDSGVVAPVYDVPYKAPRVILGNFKIVCYHSPGRAQVRLDGHAQYLGYSKIEKREMYFDYSPDRSVRIVDRRDKQYIDAKLLTFKPAEKAQDVLDITAITRTRFNHFSVEWTMDFLPNHDRPFDLLFYLSPVGDNSDSGGIEMDCPTTVARSLEPQTPIAKLTPLACQPSKWEELDHLALMLNSFAKKENPFAAPQCNELDAIEREVTSD